jgi:membrane-bound ClpP family serine protease
MNNTNIKTFNAIIMVIGLWLVVSPFIFTFLPTTFWNSIIVGAIIFLFAAIREWSTAEKNNWTSWVNIILGIWLIIASYMLGDTGVAFWSSLTSGVLTAGLAAWSLNESENAIKNNTVQKV